LIHPTAIVDPRARLAPDVEVGPWTLIEADVEIGAGTVIDAHVIIRSHTSIGKNNRIFQFCSVGEATPDLKYKGEPTRLVIGDNNTIREGVTLHRGTVQDRGETRVGDHNLLMAYVHIGHDCVVGNHCILINNASLAGHVLMDDWAILSGYTLVHQYCRIGAHSFSGMAACITKDLPAYIMATGNPAKAKTINVEGLRRRGFDAGTIAILKTAFKVLYREGLTLDESVERLEALAGDCAAVRPLIESVQASRHSRGILR